MSSKQEYRRVEECHECHERRKQEYHLELDNCYSPASGVYWAPVRLTPYVLVNRLITLALPRANSIFSSIRLDIIYYHAHYQQYCQSW